jgi:hypothetical protein
MSTIPVQTLIIDNDTNIGLSADLVNGAFKTSSLTDLSNNVHSARAIRPREMTPLSRG